MHAVKLFCVHALWYDNPLALLPGAIDRTLNSKKRLPLFFFRCTIVLFHKRVRAFSAGTMPVHGPALEL